MDNNIETLGLGGGYSVLGVISIFLNSAKNYTNILHEYSKIFSHKWFSMRPILPERKKYFWNESTIKTLGTSEVETAFAVLKESTPGVTLAIMGSFNRAIAELGIAYMIGQNVGGSTRVLTTAIAMENTRGEISLSLALAAILLAIVLSINLLTNLLQRRFQ